MRKRRAILHIGTEKTGTTTIQGVLARSRAALLERGFAYPKSFGPDNHVQLAFYAAEGRIARIARQYERSGVSSARVVEAYPAELEAEVAALPGSVHTLLLSTEHCHSRLHDEGVGRLKALLDRFCDDYRVVVYLRRQDELAVSRYSTALRTGGAVERDILPAPPEPKPGGYFDYKALLRRWGAVFGPDRIAPRLFGRAHFVGGDLLTDFRVACGLEDLPIPEMELERNPSLRPAAQEFLRRYNGLYGRAAPRAVAPIAPRAVARILNENFAGPGRLPPRAAAMAFVEACRAGNEWVRATYFPERERLFDEDFGRYAVAVDRTAQSAEAVLEVSLRVVAELVGRGVAQPSETTDTTLTPDEAAAPAQEGARSGRRRLRAGQRG
jgi:hypothetical protein